MLKLAGTIDAFDAGKGNYSMGRGVTKTFVRKLLRLVSPRTVTKLKIRIRVGMEKSGSASFDVGVKRRCWCRR